MRTRTLAILCIVGGGVVIAALVMARDIRLANEAADQQARLMLEYEQLTPPLGATSNPIRVGHKLEQAWVGATYDGKLQPPEVLAHYEDLLAKSGWHFLQDETIHELSGDFGARLRYYCKPPYTAALTYSGDRQHYGWAFSLDLSWGLHKECQDA